MSWLGLCESDFFKRLITYSMITLSGFYCSIKLQIVTIPLPFFTPCVEVEQFCLAAKKPVVLYATIKTKYWGIILF